MILFFDTETTGFVLGLQNSKSDEVRRRVGIDDPKQPHLVQLGAVLVNDDGSTVEEYGRIVKPVGYEIPEAASRIHGITTESATREGVDIGEVLDWFCGALVKCQRVVCHNLRFDSAVMQIELCRHKPAYLNVLGEKPAYCTMESTAGILKIPGYYGDWKWPKLMELYTYLFRGGFEGAHNALSDVKATVKCYFELEKRKLINDKFWLA